MRYCEVKSINKWLYNLHLIWNSLPCEPLSVDILFLGIMLQKGPFDCNDLQAVNRMFEYSLKEEIIRIFELFAGNPTIVIIVHL